MDFSSTILLAAATAAEAAGEAAEPGIAGSLGINLKLFIAQLVNFGIVLFVLWKWVFGPVAGALEKRRERIESSLREAKLIEERVESFQEEHGERLKKSKAEAEAIIQKALEGASRAKTEISEDAKKEAERILANARETIEAEKEDAIRAVRREVAELTIASTEKVLKAKLDKSEDRNMVEEVLGEIKK